MSITERGKVTLERGSARINSQGKETPLTINVATNVKDGDTLYWTTNCAFCVDTSADENRTE